MARYIKANPLVARYLQLENDRNMVSDGNYLFWQNDMLKFGPLTQLNDILVKIGGIALMPHEARSEQDGTICRPLPMATDARFQQPIKANVNDAIVGSTNTEQGANGEGENNENTENPNNGNGGEGQADEESDQQPEASESEKTESKTKK
jgi:hypothetical protein